jgi:spore maturation protein CgeB
MKIVLYGEADKRGSGAWCYRQTLMEMGHQVSVFSPQAVDNRYSRRVVLRLYRRWKRSLLSWNQAALSKLFFQLAAEAQPDIVIVLKGLYLGMKDISRLKSVAHWVVNINHDDFFSRNPNNWSELQRAAIPAYDYIFPTREVNVDEIKPLNQNVEFFSFAYLPEIHRPSIVNEEERAKWASDVLFVGTWERERCRQLESLVRAIGANYAIYGEQWHKVRRSSPLYSYIHRHALGPDEMSKAIGTAKVALGFLRKENRDDYTQRTFEIPACGGVLLAERTKRHLELLTEGKEAEFFDPYSETELPEKVTSLLNNVAKRNMLRSAGRVRITSGHHTYRDRLERLFEIYHKRRLQAN